MEKVSWFYEKSILSFGGNIRFIKYSELKEVGARKCLYIRNQLYRLTHWTFYEKKHNKFGFWVNILVPELIFKEFQNQI